jgi:hypothetical protein
MKPNPVGPGSLWSIITGSGSVRDITFRALRCLPPRRDQVTGLNEHFFNIFCDKRRPASGYDIRVPNIGTRTFDSILLSFIL